MNRTQGGALYGVLLSLLLGGIVVLDFLDKRVGWPVMLPIALVWGGLLLGPVYLIERRRSSRQAEMDERDKQIVKNALLTSLALLAGILCVAFVVEFCVLGLTRTVSITMDGVSAMIYYVFVVFVLVLSLAVLVQYRRGGAHGQ